MRIIGGGGGVRRHLGVGRRRRCCNEGWGEVWHSMFYWSGEEDVEEEEEL